MLTIGKLGASDEQLAYYERQVEQGMEDYFSGRGEAPGRWIGAGCGGIGLSGRVDRAGSCAPCTAAIRIPVSGSSRSWTHEGRSL